MVAQILEMKNKVIFVLEDSCFYDIKTPIVIRISRIARHYRLKVEAIPPTLTIVMLLAQAPVQVSNSGANIELDSDVETSIVVVSIVYFSDSKCEDK